jgi:hypothetical protein
MNQTLLIKNNSPKIITNTSTHDYRQHASDLIDVRSDVLKRNVIQPSSTSVKVGTNTRKSHKPYSTKPFNMCNNINYITYYYHPQHILSMLKHSLSNKQRNKLAHSLNGNTTISSQDILALLGKDCDCTSFGFKGVKCCFLPNIHSDQEECFIEACFVMFGIKLSTSVETAKVKLKHERISTSREIKKQKHELKGNYDRNLDFYLTLIEKFLSSWCHNYDYRKYYSQMQFRDHTDPFSDCGSSSSSSTSSNNNNADTSSTSSTSTSSSSSSTSSNSGKDEVNDEPKPAKVVSNNVKPVVITHRYSKLFKIEREKIFTVDKDSLWYGVLMSFYKYLKDSITYYINKYYLPMVPHEDTIEGTVVVLDKPSPKIVTKGDLALIEVDLVEFDKLELVDETWYTFFTRKSADFDFNNYADVCHIAASDGTVFLPCTYVDEMMHYWTRHDHTTSSYLLSCSQTSNWLLNTTLSAKQQADVLTFGPLICYNHYRHHLFSSNINNRIHQHNITRKLNTLRNIYVREYSLAFLSMFAVGVFCLKKRFSFKPVTANLSEAHTNLFFGAVISAPVIEEGFRSIFPKATTLTLIVSECLSYDSLYPIFIHTALEMLRQRNVSRYGFWSAYVINMIFHGTHNFLVMCLNEDDFLRDFLHDFLFSTSLAVDTTIALSKDKEFRSSLINLFFISCKTLGISVVDFICSRTDALVHFLSSKMRNKLAHSLNGNTSMLNLLYSSVIKLFSASQSNIKQKKKHFMHEIYRGYKSYTEDDSTAPKPTNLNPKAKVMFLGKGKEKIDLKHTYQYLLGIGDNQYRPVFYDSNLKNEKAALDHRVIKKMIDPDPNTMKKFSEFFRSNIFKLLPKTRRTTITTPSFQEYLNNSNASPGVKKKLAQVNNHLTDKQISNRSKLDKKTLSKYTMRKSFPKIENTNHRSGGIHKVKAPRLIQGATAEYICLVAPWIMNLQKLVKRDLNKNNFICFTSGVSTFDAAKIITDFDGLIIEDDVGAWDASYSEELCKLEVWMCKQLRCPRATYDLMLTNINKRGITTGGWYYSLPGIRASGDPFTSLFNSIMNAMLHMYIFCDHYGIIWETARKNIRMIIQGDDNLMTHTRSNYVPNWKKQMRRLGFDSISIYRDHFYDAEFCSMRLYPVAEGYCFGPKIGKVLSKCGYFIDPPQDLDPRILVRGTVLGMINNCSFLKPMEIFCEKILKLTNEVKNIPFKREEWQMRFSKCTSSVDTMLCLYHKYGWTNSMEGLFQIEIDNCHLGTDNVGPIFRYLCDADTAGVKQYMH